MAPQTHTLKSSFLGLVLDNGVNGTRSLVVDRGHFSLFQSRQDFLTGGEGRDHGLGVQDVVVHAAEADDVVYTRFMTQG